MSETEAQKRERILRTEREHRAPLIRVAAPVATVAVGADPIDAPFHVLLAHADKWSQPRGTTPTSVVIHCTAAENPASSTAAFFASSAPSGSTQAIADDIQGFTMVPDDAVCAGAPPFNQEGLHIEQPGLTTWTRDKWLSHDDQLQRVARHVASWCLKYDIPVILLHTADLVRLGEKAKGITYHAAVSQAFHQSTHTDPEPNYPWDVFMSYVKDFHDGKTPGGDMAVLTDDEQLYLRGVMRYINGFGPPPDTAPDKVREGFAEAKAKLAAGPGGVGTHDHPIPAGFTGKNAP